MKATSNLIAETHSHRLTIERHKSLNPIPDGHNTGSSNEDKRNLLHFVT